MNISFKKVQLLKINPLYLRLVGLGVLLNACQPSQGESKQAKQTTIQQKRIISAKNATPLFVVTGYSRELQNISLDSLKNMYCNGKVYVLKATQPLANKVLGCNNARTLPHLKAFAKLAKNHLLVTDIHHLIAQYKALQIDKVSFFGNAAQYTFQHQPEGAQAFDYKNKVTKFTLTGVTAITRNTGLAADAKGPDFLIEKVKHHFQSSDFVHISNEVSFDPNCVYIKYDPHYKFCSKERDFKNLVDLNTNIVELTGNHNKDFGAKPYKLTYDWYKKQGMKTFGGGLDAAQANTPLIIDLKDGKKMAFIGFNQSCPVGECAYGTKYSGANRYNREKARKVITDLKKNKKIDLVFASVQFNEVDSYAPHAKQIAISYDLHNFGADVVYGSQAHQVQQIEFYKGKPLFHGLGNFLFDQIHRVGVRRGYFLHHYIYNGKVVQSMPVYTWISNDRRPVLATPKQAQEIKKIIFPDRLIYKWE
ncbi:CapA family protein [uncultured Microscilla sp.]|uniref:CapA family protein n=1 Tax=uncultured Microscilla sp. TaxID=432653 RepID=UPI002608D7F6|nr:CapA family protein [uncultured Microscilla sp.]